MSLNFSPANLTVSAGTTIIFSDQDTSAVHNIDFQAVPSGSTVAQGTTSPNLKNGNSYNVTLTTPGTYTYVCDYHAWMKGTITVGVSGYDDHHEQAPPAHQTTSTTSSATHTTTSSSFRAVRRRSVIDALRASVTTCLPTFAPATITVVVGVNNTIVCTNHDSAVHNVDFQSGPTGATLPPTSVNVRNGQSTPAITLTVPGTYTYVCDYHAWMKGTVIVVAASGS